MALTQTVRVWARSEAGRDPMDEPTWAWGHADVPGVLVRPGAAPEMQRGDSASDLRPDGVRVLYTLAFPKGYDGPPLRHARVTLLEPVYGMDPDDPEAALAVSGDPRPTIPCPTPWNMTVEVGRTDG